VAAPLSIDRAAANQRAFGRMSAADPILVDVRRALDVVPGMKPNMILTSGAPLPWEQYTGPHRMGILYGAVHERLAASTEEADERIRAGEIVIGSTHHHGCIGPGTAICTASMSVFVVENRAGGNRAFCTFYEGETAHRLNWGAYGDDTIERLKFVEQVVAPVMGDAIRLRGGLPLLPIISTALRMGDELHMRATSAGLVGASMLFPALLEVARTHPAEVRRTLEFLERTRLYWFMRPTIAASKAIADAAHGVEGSSMVTAFSFNCRELAIRVSGLGDEWFRGPHPDPSQYLPQGLGTGDYQNPGGDCIIVESVGLGAFAQVAAFPNSSSARKRNLALYDITLGEHPAFRLGSFDFRGSPTGIDIFKVLETGTLPPITGFLVTKVGPLVVMPHATIECFQSAAAAYQRRYGS
jgi:hypothetical protein